MTDRQLIIAGNHYFRYLTVSEGLAWEPRRMIMKKIFNVKLRNSSSPIVIRFILTFDPKFHVEMKSTAWPML